MQSITQSQVQELVKRIPDDKLARAYHLLQALAGERERESPQTAFLRLPAEERARLLAEQAQQMQEHYEQTAEERQAWQSGDFTDEC